MPLQSGSTGDTSIVTDEGRSLCEAAERRDRKSFEHYVQYFERIVREIPGNPQAMRIHLTDRKSEAVASLQGVRLVSDPSLQGATWVGVTPDGSLLLTRDAGTQEIYALDIKWP